MFQNAMINEDGSLIDEIGSAEIYTVYICWGVTGYHVKSVLYTGICVGFTRCVCVCGTATRRKRNAHVYYSKFF